MFVFLSKFLPPLIYPIGLTLILMVVALVLYRQRRLQRAALIAAVIILLVGSNHWVAYGLTRSLEWQYLPAGEIPAADAIVLLGGGTDSADPPRPMVQVNGAGERVIYAAYLYMQGKAPYILATGGHVNFSGPQPSTPASDMQSLLVFMGVPQAAIWLEGKSQNTYENALYCAQILKAKNITRVILVTSAVHMPRSVALFQTQGIQVIPAPSDFTVTQAGWDDLTHATLATQVVNLLPSIGNLDLTTNALKEYIGSLVYRLRGWIR